MKYNPTSGWSRSECYSVRSEDWPWRQDVLQEPPWWILGCPPSRNAPGGRTWAGPPASAHTGQTGWAAASREEVETKSWRPRQQTQCDQIVRQRCNQHSPLVWAKICQKNVRNVDQELIFFVPQKWITLISSYSCRLIDSLISSLQFEDKKHWMTRYPS